MLVDLSVRADDEVVEWRHGISLARYFRGNALKYLGGESGLDQDAQLRLPQHVDEPGSDYIVVSVDRSRAGGTFEVADGRNSAVANADLARIPRRARSIDDVSVDDHQVEPRIRLCCAARDRGQEE